MNTPAPPEHFNFSRHLMDVNHQRLDKLAYVDDLSQVSYGELFSRVRKMASALENLGVHREERILMVMHDSIDWSIAFLGALYAGVVPVAVNTLLTADDYAYMMEHSRAQAVFTSGPLLATINEALAKGNNEVTQVVVSNPTDALNSSELEFSSFYGSQPEREAAVDTHADAPGFWLYSSGSTGRPKGTVHTQANLYWTAEYYGKATLGLNENDVCFSAAKLFFAYGLGNALSFPLSVGATILLMAERPTPDAVFKRLTGGIGGVKPTVFYGAPTGFAGMLASPSLPPKSEVAIRLVSSAGEALPADLGKRFFDHFGVDIVDGIGSTEMLHIFLSNKPGKVSYGTTGWPVEGYKVELRGEDGGPVADGEPGDLYICGPSAALMYWENRKKSGEAFQGNWVKSGDKYIHNADGTYTYSGRSDDMLKVSGIYVSPFEVEATIAEHPSVLESAVIGAKDTDGLVKTKAYVVLKPEKQLTPEELKSFVKERLAAYKYPRMIEFISELPKTATGKIQRFKLRELESAAKPKPKLEPKPEPEPEVH